MDIDNRREYFRVDVLIPVKWRILNKDERDLIEKGVGRTLLNQKCFKNPLENTDEKASPIKDDQIYQSLQSLNNKMDYILNIMISNSGPASVSDRITEISASGLKFRTSEKIDEGVFLKMDLLIPGTPYFQVDLIAETLRIEKTDNGYLIAANIICIDDDSREFIIKIIFQKQRIDIRRFKTCQEVRRDD